MAGLPCPSASPGVCSNLCPMSQVMPSNHLNLCCPLLLLPSIFPSSRVFSNELALCIRWPKYWTFSISSSNEYSRLTSFRIYWFDLLAVQGPLKSLLQHHNLKASILKEQGISLMRGEVMSQAWNQWRSLLHPFHWLEFSYVVTPIGKREWGVTMSFRVMRRSQIWGEVASQSLPWQFYSNTSSQWSLLWTPFTKLQPPSSSTQYSLLASFFFPSVVLTALPESMYFTSLSYSLFGM